MATRSTHYEILGVDRQADHDQIRRAYLTAARRWHPDRHAAESVADATKAERAMQRVNEAWTVLGDKASREAYDRQLVPHGHQAGGTYPGSTGARAMRTDDGVTRIDPRLLDPEFLTARREAQLADISARHSYILRAAPVVVALSLLAAIFVFTAYARNDDSPPPATTVPGPRLGAGIEANDCVDIISGPALLEVPCTATADGRVIGARLPDGFCPPGTNRDEVLSNGAIVCLAAVR